MDDKTQSQDQLCHTLTATPKWVIGKSVICLHGREINCTGTDIYVVHMGDDKVAKQNISLYFRISHRYSISNVTLLFVSQLSPKLYDNNVAE